MTLHLGMFANMFGNFEDLITELVVGLLMVAGGFLVGYIIGHVLGWAVGRYALRMKNGTRNIKVIARPMCGALLAIIVAVLVFTGRGKGPGDGGGGKGTPGDPTNSSTDPTAKVEPKVVIPKIDLKPADQTIRVTIIAGTAVPGEGRFYMINDDAVATAKTLVELKKYIEERKVAEKGKLTLAILFPIDRNMAPSDRKESKVTDVTRWATEDAQLDVIFPAIK